ncbi:MAG: 1-acyl-sn-glycerol-3-phosphate acyltransferase [Oceanospirillaceae bacterium]|nr:1-acyl-sn-glycerol-3-phosphate acyltransferase [Oceanospirillaceae bacterium]
MSNAQPNEIEQDPFHDIRPYRDDEVSQVLFDILHDNEFISAITQYQFPKASKWAGFLLRPLVKQVLAARIGDVSSVKEFQQLVEGYMAKMINRTTTKVSCSGIERLDPEEAYLFISNHRDIAMDPAFVNWMLYHNEMQTVRIAIGDNLLRKPYASDLMRLNKSFIVKRGVQGRERLTVLTQLSQYIDHSIVGGHSIWIAQRSGRSKNGDDRTDPALLKMLHMGQRKARSFAEQTKRLNIVPVAISYELDPCDAMKANELAAKAADGEYKKSEFEDIQSIVRGITGEKGHVHVSFGEIITADFEDEEALATEIDRQIHANYRLHPTNLAAAGEGDEEANAKLDARLNQVEGAAKDILRKMYAKPVENQKVALAEYAQQERGESK